MPRTHRHRVLAGLLAFLAITSSTLAGEERRPWLESLAEAKRLAKEDRRLILVYLDPGWKRGATTGTRDSLAEAILERLSEQVSVVRLPATIDDPESEAVRGRYALWNDLSGAVVIDAAGACYWADVAYSPDIVLGGVAEALAKAQVYADRLQALAGREDRASCLELARLHVEHSAFEQAVRILALQDASEALDAADLASWAHALSRIRQVEAAVPVLDRAIATGRQQAGHVDWRIHRATLRISPTRAAMLRHGREDAEIREQGEKALRALLAEFQAEGDVPGEAAVRLWLLNYVPGYAEHVAQPDWIVRNDPQGPYTLDSWVCLMNLAIAWNDIGAAKRHADAAISAHPDDDRLVPWLRDGMLPSFEKLLAADDDPEHDPFVLRATVGPGSAGHEDEPWLRVEVENRSQRELRDVSVHCHLSGPAAFLTQRVGRLTRFEPKTIYELQFPLKRTGPEAIHLVVLLQRVSAGETLTERGTHVRVPQPP